MFKPSTVKQKLYAVVYAKDGGRIVRQRRQRFSANCELLKKRLLEHHPRCGAILEKTTVEQWKIKSEKCKISTLRRENRFHKEG